MPVRAATIADIPRLMEIRAAVRENRLTGRAIASDDYAPHVDEGRCWVWAEGDRIEGFSAIEADGTSLWALFVDPGAESRGVGRALLETAVQAARAGGAETLELTTEPGSRAEAVYARFGFTQSGSGGTDVRMRLAL